MHAPPSLLCCARHRPLSSGVGRLLCAGVWIGRAGAVRHYLSRYFLAAGHVDGRAWDDQGCALLFAWHTRKPCSWCMSGTAE